MAALLSLVQGHRDYGTRVRSDTQENIFGTPLIEVLNRDKETLLKIYTYLDQMSLLKFG